MNILRQLDPSDANLADYAWRTGCTTYSEAKRELDEEMAALVERFQPPSLVGVDTELVTEIIN